MTYELMLFPDFKDKAVTLSYDDGFRHDIRLIEIMSKYGLKGTFNLNSGALKNQERIHAEELKDVYVATGNEIAVHGVKHLSLTSVSDTQIVEDIFNDRKAFENILGEVVTGMAYANGAFDDRVVNILKACGISYARTVVSTRNFKISDDWLRMPTTCHHNDEKLFELVDSFLNEQKSWYFWGNYPKLFYLWGHSHEFENNKNWDRIELFAEKIGKREDVWYATNGEIVRYVEAYKSLIFSAEGNLVYNPTAIDIFIRTLKGKNIVIFAGQTMKLD